MNSIEFEQAIRPRLDRKPFQPFAIESIFGERWVIEKREALNYSTGGNAVYCGPDGELSFVDGEFIRQVADLTPANPA